MAQVTFPFNEITVPPRMEPEPVSFVDDPDYNKDNEYTAYFLKGLFYKIKPHDRKHTLYEEHDKAYNARFIVSDFVKYDFENPTYIKNFAFPNYNSVDRKPALTFDISYILRMRAAHEYRPEFAVPLVYKAVNLMLLSPIEYSKKDYFRLVAHLWTLGEIKYADYLLDALFKVAPTVMVYDPQEVAYKNAFVKALHDAQMLGMDYLESSNSRCVSDREAPYCSRIYSISGADKRFPKLPDFIRREQGLPNVMFFPLYYYPGDKITIYEYDTYGNVIERGVDAISYSNRPFVDKRTSFEKENYEQYFQSQLKRKQQEENYYNREQWVNKYYGMLEYREIRKLLPDKAPKNFAGYMKMRNGNTKNFQKLVSLGNELNIKFFI